MATEALDCAVVIDMSQSFKVGFADDDAPRCEFPAVVEHRRRGLARDEPGRVAVQWPNTSMGIRRIFQQDGSSHFRFGLDALQG